MTWLDEGAGTAICTTTTREQHSREELSNSTELTDAEGVVIGPRLPPGCSTGRRRSWWMREVVNGVLSVLGGGIVWRLGPKDLPRKSTVYGCFSTWNDTGPFARLNHPLVILDRERVGREASPGAVMMPLRRIGRIVCAAPFAEWTPTPPLQTLIGPGNAEES